MLKMTAVDACLWNEWMNVLNEVAVYFIVYVKRYNTTMKKVSLI